MSVRDENKAFCEALNRLVTSFIKGGAQVVPREGVPPNWLTKTNRFQEFISVLRKNLEKKPSNEKEEEASEKVHGVVSNLRSAFHKLGKPEMWGKLIEDESVHDNFLLTAEDGTGGITFEAAKFSLPIGEAYSYIKEHGEEDGKFPIVILINFLSTLSMAMEVKGTEFFYIQENIRDLDGLLPKRNTAEASSNPFDMIKKFIPADLGSIISPEAIGQMKGMFTDITKTLEDGGDISEFFTTKMAEMAGESALGLTPENKETEETPAIEATPPSEDTETEAKPEEST